MADYSDASCNSNWNGPLCFSPVTGDSDGGEDAYKSSLLTATMSEQDYIKLASLNVNMYVSMLQLPPNEQKSYDLVTEWLQSGCENWIRVAKGKDVPSIDIAKDEFVVFQFLREFEANGPSQSTEATLRKCAPDGMLTEQDYIDWYMLCKYEDWKKKPPAAQVTRVAPVLPAPTAAPAPTTVVAPVAPVVDPYALTADELKYIRDNNFTGRGVKMVTRTPMPVGSIDKYARKLKLSSRAALDGVTMLKKNDRDVFTYTRFFWIDHLTKSLHWSQGKDKTGRHKSFDLSEVENISIPPKKLTIGVLKKSNTVDNHLRLKLFNGQFQDVDVRCGVILFTVRLCVLFSFPLTSVATSSSPWTHQLPLTFTEEERWDWVSVLLDCAGFADADAAAKGNRRPAAFPTPTITMPTYTAAPAGTTAAATSTFVPPPPPLSSSSSSSLPATTAATMTAATTLPVAQPVGAR